MRLIVGIFVSLALGMLVGCNQGVKSSDADLTVVNVSELRALLNDDNVSHVLIDVRRPEKFQSGHLPGAINIPVLDINRHDRRLTAQRIIVYSDGWTPTSDDQLSWAAAKKLLALGYVYVYDFRGGLELWVSSGGEVVVPDEDDAVKKNPDTQDMEDGIDVDQVIELERNSPELSDETLEETQEKTQETIDGAIDASEDEQFDASNQ